METFNDKYEVRNTGEIYNKYKQRPCKLTTNNRGYQTVGVYLNGKLQIKTVHRLVAVHHTPNPDNKPQVNHIDGNKLNNHASNLEWVTNMENQIHAAELGLRSPMKLTEEDVRYIRSNIIKGDRVFGVAGMARRFNIDQKHVSDILNRQCWKHVI